MQDKPKFSARSLTAFLNKFATAFNPIEVWPSSFYVTTYSKDAWPGVTFHNLRNPEHVKLVLVDHADAFGKGPLDLAMMQPMFGEGLLTTQGERWALQRRAAAPAFRREAINLLAPQMALAAERVTSKLEDQAGGDPVEVLPFMAELTFFVIASVLFGAAASPIAQREAEEALTTYLDGIASPDSIEVRAAIETVKSAAARTIEEQEASGRGASNLLAALVAATNSADNPLFMTEVCDNVITFLFAGNETTAVALTWALFTLANAPSIQEQVHEEVRRVCGENPITQDQISKLFLLRRVIMETMRLYPPVPTLSRLALREVDLGDIRLAEGDVANILIYPMHRNQGTWPEPELFDPDRFLDERISQRHKFAFLPFGAGPRICIGSQMAYLEQSIVLATLLRRLRFAPVSGYTPHPRVRVSLRPHDGLPLLLSRR